MKKIIALVFVFSPSYSTPLFLQNPSSWPQETLAKMTLRQKIGQLFVIAAASCFDQPTELLATSMFISPYKMDEETVSKLITDYHVGGIIFLYKSTPELQIALTHKYQNLAKIPLLIAQDCEWGLSMRLDKDPHQVVMYPRNAIFGEINDANLVYRLGNEIGKQCKALGIHLNCAPVVDINNNPDNRVIGTRSFGSDPKIVARLSVAYARGLEDAGVISCVKHFPGHGDTHVDSHHALPIINHTYERINAVELYPFKHAIASGVSGIMTAHLAIPALTNNATLPATLSYETITNLLKKNLNFQGLIVTDGLGMKAITNNYLPGESELAALRAGNDILLCSVDVPVAIDAIEAAIHNGILTHAQLDYHVLKILKAKEWAFKQSQEQAALDDPLAYIIRDEAKQLTTEIDMRYAVCSHAKDTTDS